MSHLMARVDRQAGPSHARKNWGKWFGAQEGVGRGYRAPE